MNKRYIDFVPVDKRSVATKRVDSGEVAAVSAGSRTDTVKNAVDANQKISLAGTKGATGASRSGATVGGGSAVKNRANLRGRTKNNGELSDKLSAEDLLNEMDDDFFKEMFAEHDNEVENVARGSAEPKLGVIEEYHPKFVQTNVKKRPLGRKSSNERRSSTAISGQNNTAIADATKRGTLDGNGGVRGGAVTISGGGVVAAQRGARGAAGSVLGRGDKTTTGGGTSLAARQGIGLANKTKIGTMKSGNIAKNVVTPKKSTIQMAGDFKTRFINTNKVEKRPLSTAGSVRKASIVAKESSSITQSKKEKPVRIVDKPEKDSKTSMIVAVILTIILGAAAGTVAFLMLPK